MIGRALHWVPANIGAAFVLAAFASVLSVLVTTLATVVVADGSTGLFDLGDVAAFAFVGIFGTLGLSCILWFYVAFFLALFGILPVWLFRRFVPRWWFGIASLVYGAVVCLAWHAPGFLLFEYPGEDMPAAPLETWLAFAAMGAVSAFWWWLLAARVIARDMAEEAPWEV